MNNKRKGDTSNERLIVKQPRQTITSTKIKIEEASLHDITSNSIDIENIISHENSITRNNVSLYNEIEEFILPNDETRNAEESSTYEVNATNYKLDPIKIEQIFIPSPTNISPDDVENSIENINSLISEIYAPDEIKIERSITPSSINTCKDSVENYNVNENVPTSENGTSYVITIEGTKVPEVPKGCLDNGKRCHANTSSSKTKSAQRSKRYREKQRLLVKSSENKAKAAKRSKNYRERQKLLKKPSCDSDGSQSENSQKEAKKAKTNAEFCREYRQRQKIIQQSSQTQSSTEQSQSAVQIETVAQVHSLHDQNMKQSTQYSTDISQSPVQTETVVMNHHLHNEHGDIDLPTHPVANVREMAGEHFQPQRETCELDGEIKIEETVVASSSTEQIDQSFIVNTNTIVCENNGLIDKENTNCATKYINTVNTINRYVDPKEGLYYIESNPLYKDFIQVTSSYEYPFGRVLRAWKTLPRSVLTVKTLKGHKGGVFAKRSILKGVRMGPIEMTTNKRLNEDCHAWKMANGRLHCNLRLALSNWTIFVNYTENKNAQNLTISQHKGALYFRTVKEIDVGEELLVNYDSILTVKINEKEEMCVPYVEDTLEKIHICRLCYLGFKHNEHLNNHVCEKPGNIPDSELWSCFFCNLFICEKQYKDFHIELCHKNIFTENDDHIVTTKEKKDDPAIYVNTVNSINRYIDPEEGLYYIESNPLYEDFIQITSCYKFPVGRVFRTWKTLPRSLLTVKTLKGHKGGVFALRTIFKGVRMGPLEMITNTKLSENCFAWKMINGRLYYNPRLSLSNWTIFVNYTQNKAEQNLTISQHGGGLYFRTLKTIDVGEELLVNYDDILTIKINENEEMCVPYVEDTLARIYICRICHLGFKHDNQLISHGCKNPENVSESELWKCSVCNMFICERKYKDYHIELCFKDVTSPKIDYHSKENIIYGSNNGISYINKVNSLNPYKTSLAGVYCIESNCLYNNFIHITSNSKCDSETNRGGDYRPWKTLPRSYISVKTLSDNKGGVFAIKSIPKGVRIGPIEGPIHKTLKECCGWRFENGRLLYVQELSRSNWARFISYTKNKIAPNLTITQHMGLMYFRTIKYIEVGQELFVNYDNILTVSWKGETYCVPYIEKTFGNIYACKQCNLAFKDEILYNIHVCSKPIDVSDNDLWICDVCHAFVCELKYTKYHQKYCSSKSKRKRELKEIIEDPPKDINFIHISSINIPHSTKSQACLTLPATALTSSVGGKNGVFAVKKITEGVTMGPYKGIVGIRITNKHGYLFENGNFKIENECEANWLGAVSVTPCISALNLIPFQHDGRLYFEAVKDIDVGQELLVFLNSEILEMAGKTYYVPPVRETMSTSCHCGCMLGFQDEESLTIHELTCMSSEHTLKRLHEAFCTNLSKCQHCYSLVCNCNKNLEEHEKQCSEVIAKNSSYTRKEGKEESDVSDKSNQMDKQISKIRMTSDKKYYKCGRCCFKAITVDTVYEHTKDHAKWKIVRRSNGLIAFYVCKYCRKNLITASHLESHYEKHVVERPYACRFCYFRTDQRDKMKIHIDAKHVIGWIKDADKEKGIELSLSYNTIWNSNDIESSDSEIDSFNKDENNTNAENTNEGKLIEDSRKYQNFIKPSYEGYAEKLNSLNPYIETAGGLHYIESDSSYEGFVYISTSYKYAGYTSNKPWKMLNRSVLAIKTLENHKGGVFAIKPIPRGVRLGPIEGVVNEKMKNCCTWKLDDEKLFYIPLLNHSSWARFVNYASDESEQNLTITQREGLLYFRTVKDIEVNQELLVNHHNILAINLRGQEYCVPFIETQCWTMDMCDRCNLGFNSIVLLKNHNCNKPMDVPDSELWTCKKCNSFVCEKIYKEDHLLNCQKEGGQASTGEKQYDLTNIFTNSKINTALIHIFCNDVSVGVRDRPEKTLPDRLLALNFGVTALINIRKGVTLGPFDGLIKTQLHDKHGFLFRNGNLVKNKDNVNWLSCVSVTTSLNKMNLTTVQYNGYFFFETVKDIEVGQKLFVLLNSEIQALDKRTYYVPPVRDEMITSYVCSCMSGFKDEGSLIIHKLTCSTPKYPLSDLRKCAYCDTFLCYDSKMLVEHEKQCSETIVKDVMVNKKKPILHIDEIKVPEDVLDQDQKNKSASSRRKRKVRAKKEEHIDIYTINYDRSDQKYQEQEEERCKICNKKSTRLNVHVRMAHMTVNNYNCHKCSFKTLTLDTLYEHVKGHEKWDIIQKETSSTADYKCKLCDNKFTAVYNSKYCEAPPTLQLKMKDHYLKHMVALPYGCQFCYYRSNLREHMESHIAAIHTDGWSENKDKKIEIKLSLSASTTYREIERNKCKICHEYHVYLGMHVKNKHMINKLFKCPECSYKINDIFKLQTHMQNKHKKEEIEELDEQQIKEEDSTNTASNNEMEDLSTESTPIQRFECLYCHTFNDDLEGHLKVNHRITKKVIHCYKCNFICDKNNDLLIHESDTCKKLLESIGDNNKDIKLHQTKKDLIQLETFDVDNVENKLYCCPFCLCNYKFPHHLKGHVQGHHLISIDLYGMEVYLSRNHLVETRRRCDFCNGLFKNLKSHIRLHRNERKVEQDSHTSKESKLYKLLANKTSESQVILESNQSILDVITENNEIKWHNNTAMDTSNLEEEIESLSMQVQLEDGKDPPPM